MSFDITTSIVEIGIKGVVDAYKKLREAKDKGDISKSNWEKIENAYVQHLLWRFAYPKKTFETQRATGIIITIIVCILIICGLAFSFIQLYSGISIQDTKNLSTTFEASAEGKVKIASSVVGAVVLVISLVFFYLYLRNVFQIRFPLPPHVSLKETDVLEMLENDLKERKPKARARGKASSKAESSR